MLSFDYMYLGDKVTSDFSLHYMPELFESPEEIEPDPKSAASPSPFESQTASKTPAEDKSAEKFDPMPTSPSKPTNCDSKFSHPYEQSQILLQESKEETNPLPDPEHALFPFKSQTASKISSKLTQLTASKKSAEKIDPMLTSPSKPRNCDPDPESTASPSPFKSQTMFNNYEPDPESAASTSPFKSQTVSNTPKEDCRGYR